MKRVSLQDMIHYPVLLILLSWNNLYMLLFYSVFSQFILYSFEPSQRQSCAGLCSLPVVTTLVKTYFIGILLQDIINWIPSTHIHLNYVYLRDSAKQGLSFINMNPYFNQISPLGRFGLVVLMSVCLSVCVCMCVFDVYSFLYFLGLSLALRSHDHFKASLVNPSFLPYSPPPVGSWIVHVWEVS